MSLLIGVWSAAKIAQTLKHYNDDYAKKNIAYLKGDRWTKKQIEAMKKEAKKKSCQEGRVRSRG